MKVVILAGGLGSRISEESHLRPKPMVEIGGMPILWHIMKTYAHYGFNDFIICAGYKQHIIKEYFAEYYLHMSDVTFDFEHENKTIIHNHFAEPWKVTIVDTGLHTLTGGRVKRIQKYIGDEDFMLTYGDAVSDVNIVELLKFHKNSGKQATLTAVQPGGRFGTLDIDASSTIQKFAEKTKESYNYYFVKDGKIDLSGVGMDEETIRNISQIYIVACGSAYHVGMAAQYVLEDLARIPVRVELASEFRYRNPILDKNGLAIIVSQSGETADSLAALRECKARGIRTLAIVNVIGSSIAREADNVFYTLAGPEISVATTKAYSTQLIASYILALQFAKTREEITEEQCDAYIKELQTLPEKIEKILEDKERLQWFASKQANAKDIFFIGRGIDYAISLEGSLKMKEISYIHSEAYAAGELKHGTISLIEDGRLVVAVLTQPELYKKTISNIQEVKTRGAFVMAVTTVGNTEVEKVADYVVYLPETNPIFANSLAIIPLQLFGYYVSIGRGLDVDKPRNLAKSVTVE